MRRCERKGRFGCDNSTDIHPSAVEAVGYCSGEQIFSSSQTQMIKDPHSGFEIYIFFLKLLRYDRVASPGRQLIHQPPTPSPLPPSFAKRETRNERSKFWWQENFRIMRIAIQCDCISRVCAFYLFLDMANRSCTVSATLTIYLHVGIICNLSDLVVPWSHRHNILNRTWSNPRGCYRILIRDSYRMILIIHSILLFTSTFQWR